LPDLKVSFGGEAIQPLQPPMTFDLDKTDIEMREFQANFIPWKQSRDQKVSSLLLQKQE